MSQGQRKYGLSDFLSGYFGNFGKMLIVNLLYCIPLAVLAGMLFAVFYITGVINIFVLFLLIPVMSPFFMGMVYVCRKVTERKKIYPWKDFQKGIRDNWKFSLVNGLIMYAVTSGLYVTFAYFREHLDNSFIMMYLILSALVTLVFVCVELSIVVMAVSVELKESELLKKSVLLIIQGFWQHIKTLLTYLFVSSLLFSVAVAANNMVVLLATAGILTLFLLPMFLTHIMVYNSYQTIERIVILPYKDASRKQELQQEQRQKEEKITIEELEILSKGKADEYVSLAGRMVKRSTVKKMLETKKAKGEE